MVAMIVSSRVKCCRLDRTTVTTTRSPLPATLTSAVETLRCRAMAVWRAVSSDGVHVMPCSMRPCSMRPLVEPLRSMNCTLRAAPGAPGEGGADGGSCGDGSVGSGCKGGGAAGGVGSAGGGPPLPRSSPLPLPVSPLPLPASPLPLPLPVSPLATLLPVSALATPMLPWLSSRRGLVVVSCSSSSCEGLASGAGNAICAAAAALTGSVSVRPPTAASTARMASMALAGWTPLPLVGGPATAVSSV